ERSLDSVAGDLTLMPSGYDVLTPQPTAHAALDVDLSQLRVPDIALGDDPAAPAAQHPSAGFGMDNDKLELRFELDQLDKKRF
ncbi:MAG: hypothetical protein JSR53_19420, partial [Proteobacteria bacterium]|nr:hypothetical protein [Pseudomonadota bacterium]